MFWWGKKKGGKQKPGEAYIALDVGTEFVKALVFIKEEKQCFISGKAKVRHITGTMRGGMIVNIPQATETIYKAINQACEIAKLEPESLIISLSGDLVKSLVTTVHYHRSHPESNLDAAELKNIVYKVQWKAYEQMRDMVSRQYADSIPDVKLINTSVVDSRVDGYKITNPLGFQGGTVTLSIFNAFAPLVHLGALQTVADELSLDLISIAAGPYALVKSLIPHDSTNSAIFIDVGSHITSVSVVSEGGVLGLQSFSMGGSIFTKQLSETLKISFERAEQTKLDYVNDKLKKKPKEQIKELFKNTALIWVTGVGAALEEFNHINILPHRIYLTGGGANLPEIKNALMTKGWTKNLPFSKKPYPSVINLKDINFHTVENDLEITLSDTVVLGLAALTMESDLSEDIISSMLRRIILTMQK